MLFREQRNEIFKHIIAVGLQPTDFSEDNRKDDLYLISYKKLSFALVVHNILPYHKVETSPVVPGIGGGKLVTWEDGLGVCKKWIEFLKKEIDTTDLWTEAQANAKLFALSATAPNEMFNDTELRQLEGQVRQLAQGLTALGLPANAQKLLTETVNEIPEKATRFTKKELAGWFMGAFAAQVTNLALSQEHVSAIATLIKTTFMGILQLH